MSKIYNLESFLKKHNYIKGKNELTHTKIANPGACYSIPDKDNDEFLHLYSQEIGKQTLNIVERPKEVGPLLFDIDWRFDDKHKKRQYSESDIKYLVKKIKKAVMKYYTCTSKNLEAYVFEKPNPTHDKKNNEYKDGIHIIYPKIALPSNMRLLIIKEATEAVEKENGMGNLPYINPLDDVFDTCIVKANGFMMYGSKKFNNGPLYELTHIYKHTLDEIDTDLINKAHLPKLLSNRQYNDSDEMPIKDDVKKASLRKKLDALGGKKKKKKKPTDGSTEPKPKKKKKKKVKNKDGTYDDIEMAALLTELLDDQRAGGYETWTGVCWALRTISDSLYDSWIDFSKRSSKFDQSACDKLWEDADPDGNLTIASLHMWAQVDSPKGYADLMIQSADKLFEEAIDGNEYDVAKVVYELYKHRYVCTSLKYNTWFEFQGHRWVEIEKGYTLNRTLSERIAREFFLMHNNMYNKAYAEESNKMVDYWAKEAEKAMKLYNKLKKPAFKRGVMEECAQIFLDTTFPEMLDGDRDLIGFDNGVYDLKNGIFRDGSPSDYVSMTVGFDWEDYDDGEHEDDQQWIDYIEDYFKKIMTNQEMREYILILLASYLDGHVGQEKFVIWTGTGANSKSKTVEWFQMAFGEYCSTFPTTVITGKRKDSSSATPEMADKRGVRFCMIQEPEGSDQIYVGRMKELTGGDKIYARPMYKEGFYFKPQFKLILTCNKLPHIPSSDGGTWRRLRVSPFESQFVDVDEDGMYDGKPLRPTQFPKDYEIVDKLEASKKVFLWYLITKYYPKYRDTGYKIKEPPKVLEFTEKYKKDQDVYFSFLAENTTKTDKPTDMIKLTEIYSQFRNWYRQSHASGNGPDKKDMSNYLENNGYKVRQGKIYGIAFNDEFEEQDIEAV